MSSYLAMEAESEEEEWNSQSILKALQCDDVDELSSLAELASSGAIRDYEDLFSNPLFYQRLIQQLYQAWKFYDFEHIGINSQAEAFQLQEKSRSLQISSNSKSSSQPENDLGMQDELDEVTDTVPSALDSPGDLSWRRLSSIYTLLTQVFAAPEFLPAVAEQRGAVDSTFITALLARFQPKFKKKMPSSAGKSNRNSLAGQLPSNVPISILSVVGLAASKPAEPDSPKTQEYSLLRGLLHTVYKQFIPLRSKIRTQISQFIQKFLRNPQLPHGISELLAVYGAIIKGFAQPIKPHNVEFIQKNIVPLHQPNQMLNELQPVINHYHQQLVYCLVEFLSKLNDKSSGLSPSGANSIVCNIILKILHCWPYAEAANSPKEVLLLHELEKLFEILSAEQFNSIAEELNNYLISCISSQNARVAERCLLLWQNDKFSGLVYTASHLIWPRLIGCLVADKHWNKSVNKMRGAVLSICLEQNRELLFSIAHTYYKQPTPQKSAETLENLINSLQPKQESSTAEEILLQTQINIPKSLENLRYFDFVFGHLLGSGSFSQVRYAKKIIKGANSVPSSWPEFAVKIINKQLVQQQNYEANIAREIEIMAQLIHPNITRLIGTCSNENSLYLVLEFAKKGDLHTHITSLGSLAPNSARFVAAEILRGLEYLHSRAIIYGDLKPENVLVHASSHVKLADFGSARRCEECKEPGRIEGTVDYLSPEVINGAAPVSFASDLWAFGCVLYQILAGRAPIWATDSEAGEKSHNSKLRAKQRTVPSNNQSGSAVQHDSEAKQKSEIIAKMVKFQQNGDEIYPANFDPIARDLIERILVKAPACRLGISLDEVTGAQKIDYSLLKQHEFFQGIDWANLHTFAVPQWAAGSVAPAPDSKFTRRKNSIMFAPLPQQYSFKEANFVMEAIPETAAEEDSDKKRQNDAGDSKGNKEHVRYTGFTPELDSKAMEERSEEEENEDEGEEEFAARPVKPSSRNITTTAASLPPRSAIRNNNKNNHSDTMSNNNATPKPVLGLPPRPRLVTQPNNDNPSSRNNAAATAQPPTTAPWAHNPRGNSTANSLLARVMGNKASAKQ
jgi:serine/threonine protein kinase